MAATDSELTKEAVFEILSSPRRRYLLYHLRAHGGPTELTELAEEVAAWENDITVEELSAQERKRVYVSLYQTHVPKLDDLGVVGYDSESGQVTLNSKAKRIDMYLTEGDTIQWEYAYVGAAVLGGIVTVATVTGLWVFGAVSETLLALGVAVLFTCIAVFHAVYRWWKGRTVPPEIRNGGSAKQD